MIPPLTLIPQYLLIIAPEKLCFCRGILTNVLHFALKLQLLICTQKSCNHLISQLICDAMSHLQYGA